MHKVTIKIDMTDVDNCKCEFISGDVGEVYDNNPNWFISSFEHDFNAWNYGYSWRLGNPNVIMPEITINADGSWFWDDDEVAQ